MRGTYASQQKNPPAITPRKAITDGSPRASRSVPGGNSWRAASTTRTTPEHGREAGKRPTVFFCLHARPLQEGGAGSHRRCLLHPAATTDLGYGRSLDIRGITAKSGNGTNGAIDKNAQRHEISWVSPPAMNGPTTEGTTQAVAIKRHHAGTSDLRVALSDDDVHGHDQETRAEPLDDAARRSASASTCSAPTARVHRRRSRCRPTSAIWDRSGRTPRPPPRCANIAAPRKPVRAQGYSDKPPSSRAATGSDVATAMNSKATARIREKIPHDRGRRPDAKGLVEVTVSSATALIRTAGECYSPSPPPLSPPPSDNDSQTSLHSGQTGYFFGSRLGTHTFPHNATTGVPMTMASVSLSLRA